MAQRLACCSLLLALPCLAHGAPQIDFAWGDSPQPANLFRANHRGAFPLSDGGVIAVSTWSEQSPGSAFPVEVRRLSENGTLQ